MLAMGAAFAALMALVLGLAFTIDFGGGGAGREGDTSL
jgi:hypothetical protein